DLQGMGKMEVDDPKNYAGPNKNYDHIELPAPESAGREPIGERITAALNAFVFDTNSSVDEGFKHELVFTAATKKKEFAVHSKGGREDAVKLLRHRVLKRLVNIVLTDHAEHFQAGEKAWNGFGFDNGCALYAPYMIMPLEGVVAKEKYPEEFDVLISGVEELRYSVQFVEKISLKGLNVAERAALQLLDVVSWMKLDKHRHIQFNNKAYYTSTKCPEERMEGGKVIKNGFEKSVRPIGSHLALQIDGKVSPFFKGQKLMDFIKDICDVRDIGRNRVLTEQIKGLCVISTHLPHNRIFQIKGFTKMSARDLTFDMRLESGDTKNTSIEEYYAEKYKLNLRYPDLPLIEERKGTKASYHPIELLMIVDGQRVSNTKSSPMMIADLIKRAQKRPPELFKAIEEQAYKAFLDGSKHENLNTFHCKVTSKQISAAADILFPPTVMTMSGRAGDDFKFAEKWKLGNNDRFVQPAKQTGDMYCILFDRCYSERDAEDAIRKLFDSGRQRGMDLDARRVKIMPMSSSFEELKRFMTSKADKVQAIIGFTSNNTDCVHENLKLFEAETGIVTQHCTKKVVDQVLQGKPLACGNILMKFNQKLGGVNFKIEVPEQLIKHAPELASKSKTWFTKTRMFIGLFVSHAGPQSFADRTAGIPQSEPTVVGLSYTTTVPTRQDGWWFMQQPGENLILDMVDHIVKALSNFRTVTGALPNDVTVYRNGKSEGEFKALSTEADQFKEAFERVQRGYNPTLTIIVTCVGSNYRMAIEGHGTYENVPPGTCLTAEGCNPFYKEFVMVSQRAIMGTARPIRHNVVHESQGSVGKKLSIDELKIITNALASATGIVTAPISLPSPIDSAEKVANRGRNNYKALVNADDASTASSGPPREFQHDGTDDFFAKLTIKLQTKIKNTHYWA
ncbi:hypothetical protein PFISCL1PPCAC_8782, partial [Pristionchus fissidentatus]